jgi:oxaloacetate decarboxylase (Na+ extruding) subunit gamma
MVLEGIKLAIIGISVVYLFLIILMFITQALGRILPPDPPVVAPPRPAGRNAGTDHSVIAAITAAIGTHRKKQ